MTRVHRALTAALVAVLGAVLMATTGNGRSDCAQGRGICTIQFSTAGVGSPITDDAGDVQQTFRQFILWRVVNRTNAALSIRFTGFKFKGGNPSCPGGKGGAPIFVPPDDDLGNCVAQVDFAAPGSGVDCSKGGVNKLPAQCVQYLLLIANTTGNGAGPEYHYDLAACTKNCGDDNSYSTVSDPDLQIDGYGKSFLDQLADLFVNLAGILGLAAAAVIAFGAGVLVARKT